MKTISCFFFNAVLLIVLSSSHSDGQILDTLFGDHGTVMTSVSYSAHGDEAYTVLVQPDQKIITVGTADDGYNPYLFGMVRYRTDGTLDPTFGVNGKMKFRFYSQSTERGYGAAMQADGKLIVVGSSYTTDIAFGIARFDTSGSIDTTFGSHGVIRTYLNGSSGANDEAYSAAVQTDGKIVVAGKTHYNYNYAQFGVVRYKPSGMIDSTFGTNGVTSFFIEDGTTTDDICYSVALQNDGKIVLAGTCYSYSDTTRYIFGVARLNINGTLDTTFGNKGRVKTPISNGGLYSTTDGDVAYSVALQQDGKIVAGGYSLDKNGHYSFALVRYNSNGTMDTTFGIDRNGKVRSHIYGGNNKYDFGRSIAIQSNGKIVMVGSSSDDLNQGLYGVIRYNTNGVPDYLFGALGTGSVRIAVNGGSASDDARAVALQSDGKIVLAGFTRDLYTAHYFSLARVLPQEGPSSIETRSYAIPGKFGLMQNYPNPFNPSTTISFHIGTRRHVSLQIHDLLGREVARLVDEVKDAGDHNVTFNAGKLASGVYFYRLQAGNNIETKKLLLLK
jgi:uncharacterized delta-60 repeat protein